MKGLKKWKTGRLRPRVSEGSGVKGHYEEGGYSPAVLPHGGPGY